MNKSNIEQLYELKEEEMKRKITNYLFGIFTLFILGYCLLHTLSII